MIYKRGYLYDGKYKVTIDDSMGRMIIKINGSSVNSTTMERILTTAIKDKLKITEDVYIGNYNEVGFLIVKGLIKRLDKNIWKYIPESELPEL